MSLQGPVIFEAPVEGEEQVQLLAAIDRGEVVFVRTPDGLFSAIRDGDVYLWDPVIGECLH